MGSQTAADASTSQPGSPGPRIPAISTAKPSQNEVGNTRSLDNTTSARPLLTRCRTQTSSSNPLQAAYPAKVKPSELRKAFAHPVLASFIAGGVAGAVSRTVVSPLERLKILFQVQSVGREEYKLSVGKALVKMWREEGWRGFMRGNGTNCIRIVPYSAVQFGSYNLYKRVSSKQIWAMADCLCASQSLSLALESI